MFVNRIRLPFQLFRPQFPEEREVFRKADGTVKVQSAVVRKTYVGDTDLWPEKWHERFKIALSHDNVNIEGDRYFGGVVQDGNYQINWPEFLDYPTGKAEFTVQVTPFHATNDSCSTCEELQQVTLEDDVFDDPLEEEETYNLNVATNDSICCYPSTFSIASYNTDILESASISEEGVITLKVKADVPSYTDALLLTYRVTCPNGGYDEASVYGDITGSVEACLAPANIRLCADVEIGEAEVCWDAVDGAVSYYWESYSSDNPGTPAETGTTTETSALLTLNDDYPVGYTFYVRTNCTGGTSDFGIPLSFNNKVITSSCGRYKLTYIGINLGDLKPYSYTGCVDSDGNVQLDGIPRTGSIAKYAYPCLLQSAPGVPVYLAANNVTVEYLELCGE